jgi:hypothetical protein
MAKQFPADVPFVDGSGNAVSNTNWIFKPDLSAVTGFPPKYWIIAGDVVTLMDSAARDAVDAALLNATRDAIVANLDQVENIMRAFMLVVMDEINVLRGNHSLSDRTAAQLKTAIRNKLGT